MKKLVFLASLFVGVVTTIFHILGYFGKNDWKLDLLSHFRVQYLVIYLIVALTLLLVRWRFVVFFTPFMLLIALELSPFYMTREKSSSRRGIKIASLNLLSYNSEFDLVTTYIEEKNPDIIVLEEFNELWEAILDDELKSFPNRILIPRQDNFGIAIYSKVKFDTLSQVKLGTAGIPSIFGRFTIHGGKVSILATHPLPPVDKWYFDKRNDQLSAIVDFLGNVAGEKIVIGDLNTSSFSVFFKQILDDLSLVDSRNGFGLQTTWPTWFPPAYTTLDHILTSEGVVVIGRDVGGYIGSDHLPIYAELDVKNK